MTTDPLPTLNWGIIGTGLISSWFTQDITKTRPTPATTHNITAIASSSSTEKTQAFIEKHLPDLSPTPKTYNSYATLFADPDVQVVYIGTPHGLHKQHCLDAIAAGKHVLCEKAFTLNAAEAKEVLSAAEQKGVFIMEAMWTRFLPLTLRLQELLHIEKAIGDVRRVFCDFGLEQDLASLPADSRLKDPRMGAGSLLDIGIYAVTWGLLTLESEAGREEPRVIATQSLRDGIDIASSILLHYPSTGRQGVLTSSTEVRTPKTFLRIEGTEGIITVDGPAASAPRGFTVYKKGSDEKGERYDFEPEGMGFYFEADAVAKCIAEGKRESEIMPHKQTVRVLELLDEVRAQGGAKFPQEE
ncbi:hypothetical protein BJY04DRAFT_225429 [Aspergillus karnatakaensis]|uniref:Gfo/Idh/MocA family protein n=1 Tax=Aspergillus karnatakaensis TaxID=1810916 RepID=UPI003CCE3EF3